MPMPQLAQQRVASSGMLLDLNKQKRWCGVAQEDGASAVQTSLLQVEEEEAGDGGHHAEGGDILSMRPTSTSEGGGMRR